MAVDSRNINGESTGINVATTSAATGGVTVNSTGDIVADARGIHIIHRGAGAVVVNSRNINSEGRAIDVETTGDLTVNATGGIVTRSRGINIVQSSGSLVINTSGNINAEDNTVSDTGINVVTLSATDSVTINATGDITSAGSRAINATHLGTGELSIFLAPDADITAAVGSQGIYAAANTAGRSGNPAGGMNIMAMGDIGSLASQAGGGILAEHYSRRRPQYHSRRIH